MRAMRIPSVAALLLALATCSGEAQQERTSPATDERAEMERAPDRSSRRGDPPGAGERVEDRERMVRQQLEARDIDDPRVLRAMRTVPRHRFVPAHQVPYAYRDHPLRIGHDQTISQPYIVALMSQLAEVSEGEKVLEIGTGSGYQAAVLAELGADVYSIEIVRPLGERARETLRQTGYSRIHLRIGDGYQGWPEAAPFDAILLTAAPPRIPEPLLEQLAVGGRLVAPVGRGVQELVVIVRTEDGLERHDSIPVRFVPMTGRAQEDG